MKNCHDIVLCNVGFTHVLLAASSWKCDFDTVSNIPVTFKEWKKKKKIV